MTKEQEKAVQALECAAWWREKNAPPATVYPLHTPGRMLQEQAQSIREALRVFFLVLTLALVLGGCASQVDIEYTPGQVCARWCEDRVTCDPTHANRETCLETCSDAVRGECGAAQIALRMCTVDTDEIRGACGFEGCRCQEELEAARRCEE